MLGRSIRCAVDMCPMGTRYDATHSIYAYGIRYVPAAREEAEDRYAASAGR